MCTSNPAQRWVSWVPEARKGRKGGQSERSKRGVGKYCGWLWSILLKKIMQKWLKWQKGHGLSWSQRKQKLGQRTGSFQARDKIWPYAKRQSLITDEKRKVDLRQCGTTCGAIDEPRSSKAIDIIDFCNKNVVIVRFVTKMMFFYFLTNCHDISWFVWQYFPWKSA